MDLTTSKLWKNTIRKENKSTSLRERKLTHKVDSHLSKVCARTLRRLAKAPYRGGKAILPILAYKENMLVIKYFCDQVPDEELGDVFSNYNHLERSKKLYLICEDKIKLPRGIRLYLGGTDENIAFEGRDKFFTSHPKAIRFYINADSFCAEHVIKV